MSKPFKRRTVRRPGPARDARAIEAMVRVDHAGEYGAVRIYRGQRAVFGANRTTARTAAQLREMEADEQHHLDAFDGDIRAGLARPTLLAPAWNAAGVALGAVTALMSEHAAHACTEAVETVIEGHYNAQIEALEIMGETELAERFTRFRDEEVAHKNLAVEEGARQAPGYPVLSAAIKAGCHAAIEISKRV
ncbi:demethoxyubiquinone hydroxylase family protein [Alkalicaulis satelles]|uniref:3-demethoxyubiquinol 3-hydroxylase n=1 Tax=Alkalicaulis satelles TaxID=2609175 RepID=A0A5M6ZC19_9PROT|nr:demethoxyubiquinone hydroxylase family protein [Alkalicaulis satelles]KAA5802259.1 demethoxyubiquinone hydroxylase family protein [Alkalicaulis satelles]